MPCRLRPGFASPALFVPVGYPTCSLLTTLGRTGEQLQEPAPITFSVEDSTHLIATRSIAIQTTVLQFDVCTIATVGVEAELNLSLQGWVILPVGVDVPREDQARG